MQSDNPSLKRNPSDITLSLSVRPPAEDQTVTRALQSALSIADAAQPSISRRAVRQKQGLGNAEATTDTNCDGCSATEPNMEEKDFRREAAARARPQCFVCRLQSDSPLGSLLTVERSGGK